VHANGFTANAPALPVELHGRAHDGAYVTTV
jgi:hypothetical protein